MSARGLLANPALFAGELRPTRGSISIAGEPALPPTVAHLPQLLADAPAERTLADELGVGGKLAALARIEAGEGDDDDFARLADDWSIAERTGALLAERGADGGRGVAPRRSPARSAASWPASPAPTAHGTRPARPRC